MITFDAVSYTYPFQSTPAVRDLNFHVAPGEAVLVTGASGSGKSTIIRLLNGLAPWYFQGDLQGKVSVNGHDNRLRPIHGISRDVGTLFQDPEQQFFALNVEDEMAFAHEWRNTQPSLMQHCVQVAMEQFGITSLAGASVHHLSEGQKQKVALASVMSLAPRILILDEPSANLDPDSTAELAKTLLELKQAGMTLLIVDHRLYWLREVVDRVIIMEKGGIAEITDYCRLDECTLQFHYGLRCTRVDDVRASLSNVDDANPYIDVQELHFAYRRNPPLFHGESFRLPRGEIIGLIGPNGAGKTTFARLLTGLQKMDRGSIALGGEKVSTRELLRRTSIVLQNTDHQLHMKTVRSELNSAAASSHAGVRSAEVEQLLREYQLEHLAERHPQSLSGGERQRLVIACGQIRQPYIFILDEPTSGLDGENMAIIADNLTRFASQGGCVLLISHDLELLQRACTCKLELGAPAEKDILKVS
ncbi:ABC transporter ATP-binding protein [Desulfurispira natronophila]|uniref:Energy-coupling factor transport system ATP-binding protein n=1 Tax=Desulfurispira natronophila TaxID=682562 RepID=A0A7W7Y488_9BACT|nr:ATP-binding cassette domain-containing protein [Desulfurispira natronophila]MBB5021537.1 energy-coupling factor transport system ATP-binding protein [Desulfurispira natronophila]